MTIRALKIAKSHLFMTVILVVFGVLASVAARQSA